MARLSALEKYYRQLRYERLQYRGFFAWEAGILKKFPMTRSYMRRLIAARQRLLLKAIREDWSREQYRYAVRLEYEAKNWNDGGGNPSVYKMLKAFRKRSIELGEYTPPPPKRRPIAEWKKWKGDVLAQKARWRATHKPYIARSKRIWREKQRQRETMGRVAFDESLGRYVVVPA